MNNLEELKKKYEELGKEIERLEKEKKNKRWRAKDNGNYYFIDSDCNEECSKEFGDCLDNARYQIGNYFKTEKEAQKVVNKIKTYIKLKQLAEELNGDEEIDWNSSIQKKHSIYIHSLSKQLFQDYYYETQGVGQIYCIDEDFLDKAIEQIGEERLKELFE